MYQKANLIAGKMKDGSLRGVMHPEMKSTFPAKSPLLTLCE
jgi:hypothetical protein